MHTCRGVSLADHMLDRVLVLLRLQFLIFFFETLRVFALVAWATLMYSRLLFHCFLLYHQCLISLLFCLHPLPPIYTIMQRPVCKFLSIRVRLPLMAALAQPHHPHPRGKPAAIRHPPQAQNAAQNKRYVLPFSLPAFLQERWKSDHLHDRSH